MTERLATAIGDAGFSDSKKLRDALRVPFDPREIGKLPKGGIQLDYVGHAAVTNRLLREAPDYTYRIDHMETKDGHLLGILATMTIGGKSIQEGGAPDRPGMWGEELKLAISDFIRRGAMRFGVALDLWSKEDLQTSPATSTPPEATKSAPVDGETSLSEASAPEGADAGEFPVGSSRTWEEINANATSGEVGEGEASASPELSAAKVAAENPNGDAPASQYLWAEAARKGYTRAKVLARLKAANQPVTDASSVTASQLNSILNAGQAT